jgi:hypothetical protein
MRLGIVVVYLVPEGHEGLLDLHLRQIEKHTLLPYTIFGCATRVSPAAAAMLAAHPGVVLCDCPPAPAGSAPTPEHAHYLEHLTRAAVESGATHVVTLHVDSFPVDSGWAGKLAGRLSDRCVLVAPDGAHTACMMFTREFHVTLEPSFLVTETERRSSDYTRFLAAWNPAEHGGTGYLFRAFRQGCSVHALRPRVSPAADPPGELYDGVVFHLGGASYVGREASGQFGRGGPSRAWAKGMVALTRTLTPRSARQVIRRLFGLAGGVFDTAADELWQRRTRQALAELTADPDGYIDRLRQAAND